MKYYNKQLNSKFWDGDKLIERIRKKLISIGTDFYESTKLEPSIKDIVLTGSLANYNYNKYSDFDVHIIIDFSEIYGKKDVIEAGINSYRVKWNDVHNIVIQGHDVEVYIQDISEKHTASGVYSLLKDKWIIKPEYNEPEINEKEIDERYKLFKSGIKQLLKASNTEMSPILSKKYYITSYQLKKKIHGERKTGLLTDKAEFSVGNLVFKRLRNSGYFGELISVIHKFYDKIYAQ
jgi:predicted nucleotidyltransferase